MDINYNLCDGWLLSPKCTSVRVWYWKEKREEAQILHIWQTLCLWIIRVISSKKKIQMFAIYTVL